MGLGATACIFAGEVGEIKLINDFNNKPGQVIFTEANPLLTQAEESRFCGRR